MEEYDFQELDESPDADYLYSQQVDQQLEEMFGTEIFFSDEEVEEF